MLLSTIRLQNFRSYKDGSFEFEPGVNIIVGPNASGKTNLLESIMVLARGSSYRAKDTELIQFKRSWARLDGMFDNRTRVLKLKSHDDAADKTFEFDGMVYKRLNLDKTIPLVFFEPNHLQLITRGPDQRREYFDDMLERSEPGFKSLAGNYRRALAQRNALLKHGPARARQQLFAWNVRLSELGAKIVQARQELIDEINKGISASYGKIARHKSNVELKYDCQFPAESYASRMLSKLEKNTGLDLSRGFTSSGPHREDIVFFLDSRPVNSTASRGETRSLLLSLKLFELSLIEKARGRQPLFLLDDVFSELDGSRRKALVDSLAGHQTFITTTDAEAVLEYFSDTHNLIPIQAN